jgi:hypothetical protein
VTTMPARSGGRHARRLLRPISFRDVRRPLRRRMSPLGCVARASRSIDAGRRVTRRGAGYASTMSRTKRIRGLRSNLRAVEGAAPAPNPQPGRATHCRLWGSRRGPPSVKGYIVPAGADDHRLARPEAARFRKLPCLAYAAELAAGTNLTIYRGCTRGPAIPPAPPSNLHAVHIDDAQG